MAGEGHHHNVWEGLLKSLSMILASEVGDKTFFVAALMAMRYKRRLVLIGALGALWSMTILSAAFGWMAPNLIPHKWTHHAAIVLFLIFGIRSIWDGMTSKSGESEELKEVEKQLKQEAFMDDKNKKAAQQSSLFSWFISPIVIQTFSLTFLGEWGDKSQIATIGLAAEDDVVGVALGGMLGHLICTSVAVVGGRHLAAKISERTVAICGGLLFLAFAAHAFIQGPEQQVTR
eukprot:TRINITY_DN14020_c0_g1_i3.p1 TRINITY_DN14020_c0_g1~~TRINITY_DN14020_c0_g1_i3.p1  ORF type:complete len:232 (+),score=48.39 TRINITY_DN14020_c0_g1_i3:561-1256(+)